MGRFCSIGWYILVLFGCWFFFNTKWGGSCKILKFDLHAKYMYFFPQIFWTNLVSIFWNGQHTKISILLFLWINNFSICIKVGFSNNLLRIIQSGYAYGLGFSQPTWEPPNIASRSVIKVTNSTCWQRGHMYDLHLITIIIQIKTLHTWFASNSSLLLPFTIFLKKNSKGK
jgi:hypothetical protein